MRFDIEDMRQFADRHRGKNITSGPHWSTIIRFPVLFDECERMYVVNEKLHDEISELSGLLGKVLMLGLLRGSPRLLDEALRILDGVETSDIDGSKQDFNNPDFNDH